MLGAIGQYAVGESEVIADAIIGAFENMLTTQELLHMRDSTELLMPDTCNILSVTNTPDGQGGVTQTWGTVSSSIACRLDILSRQNTNIQIDGAALREYQETILSVPFDTTVENNNRVEHGGLTYNVTSTNTDQSWIAVKRVYLERI